MKLSILLEVCFAAASANAFGFPSIDNVKQFILSTEEQITPDNHPIDLLAEQRAIWGDLKESYYPEVVSIWEKMQGEMDPEVLKNKIHQYNSKNSLKSGELHNKIKSSGKEVNLEELFSDESDDNYLGVKKKDLQKFVLDSINKDSEDSDDENSDKYDHYWVFDSKPNSNFEVLSSDKFEDYTLRIKKTHPEALGLDTVDQYTGYLDVNDLDKHFFYWFFESRNDPVNDPIILWLNGGPGCSSATGLFFELGPSSINATLQPVYNPYSWNSNASVIFLDQPVGVGYSYTETEEIKSTASAAKDVFIFLELFFQKFPQFLNNKFHIAGESYAGHYIPSFASEIINNADRSFELSSVLIGNGITDALIQYGYYRPMACGEGGYKPVISEEKCEQMDEDFKKCEPLIKLCYSAPSAFTCIPSTVYCEKKMMDPFSETGLNVYDIRMKCEDEGGNCYKEMDYLDDYLNLEYVKEAVGADNIDIFTSCDDTVFKNFILSGDEMKPFQQYVAELLENGIPVLLYAGDKDFICNWLGNHAWSDALDYFQHNEFENESFRPWVTKDNKLAGEVKNYGIFTFLRVYDAGHMVPFDQPENSLDMVNRWIQGDYSYKY